MPEAAKPERVGDEDEVEVSERFIESVSGYAFKRLEENQPKDWAELVPALVRAVILETVHELAQDGVCFFNFHRIEFDPSEVRDGVCEDCERPVREHEQVFCCPVPEVRTISRRTSVV